MREFALYGETTGETDEFGLPVRYNWAAEYRGAGDGRLRPHARPEPEWLNRTINIDTGCVFGGKLTALRYPEKELVSVPAGATYCRAGQAVSAAGDAGCPVSRAQQQHDDLLDIDDVLGKRIITTRLHRNVTIREENAIAALEVMSRFAANPKWLIYLPPTMSPSRDQPSSRACWSIPPRRSPTTATRACRRWCARRSTWARAPWSSSAATRTRRADASASSTKASGICYTRTGRRFFDDAALEAELLDRVRAAADRGRILGGVRDRLGLPRLRADAVVGQGPGTAAAAVRRRRRRRRALRWREAVAALATGRRATAPEVDAHCSSATSSARTMAERLRRRLPALLLAGELGGRPEAGAVSPAGHEGHVHADKDHVWHMETLAGSAAAMRAICCWPPLTESST